MADPNRMSCRDGDINFGKEGGITNGAKWYSISGGNVKIFINRVIFTSVDYF